MRTDPADVHDLARDRPEWGPWLAVVGKALDEIGRAHENVVLHVDAARGSDAPLLANALLEIDCDVAQRVLSNVMRTAAHSGGALMQSLARVSTQASDAIAIIEAAVNRDVARLAGFASRAGADADALAAVAALGVVPFLQSCARLSEHGDGWTHGYCPVCGDWPAFAEMRGVERTRHYRCGACGSEWQTSCLKCAFCGTIDHDVLASLVPQDAGNRAALDVCNACHGYVKVLTTLHGTPAALVPLQDLATAELDIAAAERGYARASLRGYTLDLRVTTRPVQQRSA